MLIPGPAMITLATAPYTNYSLKLHDVSCRVVIVNSKSLVKVV